MRSTRSPTLGPRGSTAAILMAHGFTAEMLAGLVRDGLATVASETVKAGGRAIEVGRVGITPAGRRAIEACREER